MKAGIVIGHLNNKGNEGCLIRSAEAFGINNVFVIGKKEDVYKQSMGSDRHVNFFEFATNDELIRHLIKGNFSIVCIENVCYSKPLADVKKYPVNPVFITGHEKMGMPEGFLSNAKLRVKIPQAVTYTNCLNTTVAGSIVFQDFYQKQQKRQLELWQ